LTVSKGDVEHDVKKRIKTVSTIAKAVDKKSFMTVDLRLVS